MNLTERIAQGLEVALLVALSVAALTGWALEPFYAPTPGGAFQSVEAIRSGVENGWILHRLHHNAASLLFLCVFLYFGLRLLAEPHSLWTRAVWSAVGAIGVLAAIAAFAGGVMPFSNSSYWQGVVADNLLLQRQRGADQMLEGYVAAHLWAGWAAAAIGLAGLAVLTPQIARRPADAALACVLAVSVLTLGVFGGPFVPANPDEQIMATPMRTPQHIVPDWPLSPFYAILRAAPDKIWAIWATGAAMAGFLIAPLLSFGRARAGSPISMARRGLAALFLLALPGLAAVGLRTPDAPMLGGAVQASQLGAVLTVYFFVYLFVLRPALGIVAWATQGPDQPDPRVFA